MESLESRIYAALNREINHGLGEEELTEETKKIYQNIQSEIDKYYIKTLPSSYKRTNTFKNSLQYAIANNNYIIYFRADALYMHSNIANTKDIFVPTLVDRGWYYRPSPYHFGCYEGDEFISRAIRKYRKPSNSSVTITIQSKYYPKYYSNIH